MADRPTLHVTPWTAALIAILVMLAVLFLTPTVGVLLSSIKTTRAIAMGDLWSIPGELFLGNYAEVLSKSRRSPLLRQHPDRDRAGNRGVDRTWRPCRLCLCQAAVPRWWHPLPCHCGGHVLSAPGHPGAAVQTVQWRRSHRHAVADIPRPHGAGYSHLHAPDEELLCHRARCPERGGHPRRRQRMAGS